MYKCERENQILSMGLGKIFNVGDTVKDVVDGVGSVVDRFVHTDEEKQQLKAELEREISARWASDMKSDSWLSKNVRPLVLLSSLGVFFVLLFTDGNIGEFQVQEAWIPVFQTILITALGGYFVGRSVEKVRK